MNDPESILHADTLAKQIKLDIERESQSLEQLRHAPQVVAINGGHAKEISFETDGIVYEGNCTIGNIIQAEGIRVIRKPSVYKN